MKLYWNPFKCYAITSIVVLLLYSLRYSSLFPELTLTVYAFLLSSSILSLALSWKVSSLAFTGISVTKARYDFYIACAFTLGFLLEVLYAGTLPILSGGGHNSYDYVSFGIPVFHVFLIGASFFYSVYWWDLYIQNFGFKYFIYALSIILWAILIMNRGAVLICLISFLFAYGNRVGIKKKFIYLLIFSFFIVWFFALVGDVRTKASGDLTEDMILKVGGANENFKNSGLPNFFYWFYIYVTSPLANLQTTINHISFNISPLNGIIIDFLPDFVSKRILSENEIKKLWPTLITPQLTVATAFARPIITLGLLGPYLLILYFLVLNFLFLWLIRRSKYSVTLNSIFCAQGTLLFFDNMIVFSGAVCQVIFGLLLVFFENKKFVLRSLKGGLNA